MREIKFRAWVRRLDMMCNVTGIDFERNEINILRPGWHMSEWFRRDQVELMQYTGLKDVRGVEIYEGDIVEGGIEGRRSLIEISSYEWLKKALEDEFNKTYCNYKIIGNKFENPELLEEEL
ncbi:YopX domain-containing protein [Latilactobacillus phage TMW 1.1393 P1]|uniref:YopX family protein n=1 Tax=Latilactobacillus sakei TaxID=1599 RepID=UPI00279A5101|nr:YopX domain-containing protein [Latilactobacillus phage TMW 1.1393 P1]